MVKTISVISFWTCPNCRRQFERQNHSHSCKVIPINQQFERKQKGNILYQKLINEIEKSIGYIKVESLECCIHFVSTFSFAAVKIFKDKIRLAFALNYDSKNDRIKQIQQISAHRFLYIIDISHESEIDQNLINCIIEASEIN